MNLNVYNRRIREQVAYTADTCFDNAVIALLALPPNPSAGNLQIQKVIKSRNNKLSTRKREKKQLL